MQHPNSNYSSGRVYIRCILNIRVPVYIQNRSKRCPKIQCILVYTAALHIWQLTELTPPEVPLCIVMQPR
jgi:hypothetical protein